MEFDESGKFELTGEEQEANNQKPRIVKNACAEISNWLLIDNENKIENSDENLNHLLDIAESKFNKKFQLVLIEETENNKVAHNADWYPTAQ